MTSPQLEPSAHAPCTSTTLRAAAGLAACADASAARSTSIAESMLTANVIHFHRIFIAGLLFVVLSCLSSDQGTYPLRCETGHASGTATAVASSYFLNRSKREVRRSPSSRAAGDWLPIAAVIARAMILRSYAAS